jgi:outer membrane cobalamin receptor
VEVRSATSDRSVRRYGLALEYELRPTERLGLVAGALHHWLDGSDLSDHATGFSAGVTLEASPTTRLRASAAHRFRFPTLRQLYDRDGGNPALSTERADLFELGAEQQVGALTTIGLTLFQTDARDFIERSEDTDRFQNAEHYRFRGVEVVGTVRPVEGGFVRLGYSFLDADDRSAGRAGVTLQYRPRHKLTGEARWAAPWGMEAALNVQHLAGQVYHSRRIPLVLGDLPDYTLVGVRLEQQLPRFPLSVYGGVDNLFDEAYEESYGFPLARRVAYLGIDVRL